MLGVALRPDPESWEYGTQPPPYQEYESPEPENEDGDERSSDDKEYPLLLQIPEDVLPDEEKEWILASVIITGNLWEPKYGNKPPFQATYQPRLRQPEPGTYYEVIYRDSIRIVFQALGLARIAESIPGQEIGRKSREK
jgi:hypothetical protein